MQVATAASPVITSENLAVAAHAAFIRASVQVMVLAREGYFNEARSALRKLGAQERFVDAPTGYLRVVINPHQVPRIAAFGSVQIVELSEAFPKSQYRRSERSFKMKRETLSSKTQQIIASQHIPPADPYSAVGELGALRLRRLDARFDGRGTVIAALEAQAPDFLHTAFTRALSVTGKVVPKFADIITTS